MKKIKLVVVVWRDAHSVDDGWQWLDIPTESDPLTVTSVGWQLDGKHGGKRGHISIAQSVTDQRAICSILHIPKGMVDRITPLAEGEFKDGGFFFIP